MRALWTAILVSFFTIFGISAVVYAVPTALKKKPVKAVIIDTDMAIDDWMAILYLLNHPGADVKGITVTGTGEAYCKHGVDNALKLIKLAGKSNIPVACGREETYPHGSTFPQKWRDQVNALLDIELPASTEKPSKLNAVQLLKTLTKDLPQKPLLLTLGPLTNIADAFEKYPELVHSFEHIYVMGGSLYAPGHVSLTEPGRVNDTAEWNIHVDPQAAHLVMESGAPITLVGLDATNHVRLNDAFYAQLQKDATTPSAKFVLDITTKKKEFVHSGGWYFWDPLAAAIMLDNNFATLEKHKIAVLVQPEKRAGQTVIANNGAPIRVAVEADAPRFYNHFLEVLNNRFTAN